MDLLINETSRCLLVAAAPKEAHAVLEAFECTSEAPLGIPVQLDDRFDLVRSGVGKSAAAASTMRALVLKDHRTVLSVGIAGALPSSNPIQIGESICATRSAFSDEGVGASDRFIPMSELGFPPFANGSMHIEHDPKIVDYLRSLTHHSGPIATVSWCSGDDQCAQGVVDRTGAIAEAMEGAACAQASQILDPTIRTGELRVISNTTGDRT
ncbi:MAG: futalosine hydrolase, partial [Phycisphaerales bacterium]|nr:futalosine hydrolase [Phycisphaerales bacterium]